MKLKLYFLAFFLISFYNLYADEPDSAYIFSYVTDKNNNTNGLHFAWSIDNDDWHAIGPEFRYLFSDYGRWGTQKKLIDPCLFLDKDGLWHCLWTLNDEVGQFAHASSKDLCNWNRQSYPYILSDGNIKNINVKYDSKNKEYIITWNSQTTKETSAYKTTTTNFNDYTTAVKTNENLKDFHRDTLSFNGAVQVGMVHKVPWAQIENMIKYFEWSTYQQQLRAENTSTDPIKFADLKPVDAKISPDTSKSKKISDMLIGIFFEDISYAADGGLYAELIQNRDFEYKVSDKLDRDSTWNSKKAWSISGNGSFKIDSTLPIHPNNSHYAVLTVKNGQSTFSNEGYNGIAIKDAEKYDFSLFAKSLSGEKINLQVKITSSSGEVIAQSEIKGIRSDWKKYKTILLAKKSIDNARIEIVPDKACSIALDMVSLFPQETFMGRENGLRKDLAQTIADLNPKFVRFPGGCVAHGDGLDNIYRWNRTVGPLEARVPQRNIWNYHQTAGLGYFEYFQFCEDIGAEPVPVLAAAVPCQNSCVGGNGQQGGIPMNEMDAYIQEILDLVEWANGDKNTKWGSVRAEAGHPKPFNLKYIGIGNEDLITDIFEERFAMIYNAVKEKYPDITVIGTVGPFNSGTDYEEGWDLAEKYKVPMVDEHYYQTPGWFINNQDFYDKYDRSKSKVYLGEYAAHLPGRPNNIETALSEALYLLSVERNGDVVSMTSYAPLLAKEGFRNWSPDLIYFDNTEINLTVDYYVQKIFGNNSGDKYVPSSIEFSENDKDVTKRVAVSIVKDSKTNEWIVKMVNLLPVEVNTEIDMSPFNSVSSTASVITLQGAPGDGDSVPKTSTIDLLKTLNYKLPAYSLSVIRFK